MNSLDNYAILAVYEARIRDLESLLEINKSLSSNLHYSSVLDAILLTCMGRARVLKAGLFIKQDIDSKEFTLHRNYAGFDTDRKIKYSVNEDCELINTLERAPKCYTMTQLMNVTTNIADIKTFTILEPTLIVPLMNRGKVQGILVLGERIINEPYLGDEEDFLLNVAGMAAIAIDNSFLFEVSTTDMMTKLKLKHVLFQTIKQSFNSDKKPINLLMMDIDHFKNLNDTYGHSFGDIVLIKVASVLLASLRLEDLAARYGGEEFVIVLNGMNTDDAKLVAERIRERIESLEFPYTEQGKNEVVKTTISTGIARYNGGIDFVPEDLIKRADSALYKAKEGGRNRVEIAT
ncbi:MAG: diguanylate cyclase [Spirochaetia bacterium]|jgi:two-component system cell cycle response regulator|nr:diguanylate cyclase [Spirochaetia bacterium]